MHAMVFHTLGSKCTYNEFIEESFDSNQTVSKLLAEVRHGCTRQLVGDDVLANTDKHIHRIAGIQRNYTSINKACNTEQSLEKRKGM